MILGLSESLSAAANSLWTIAKYSVNSSLSNILSTDVLFGNQTQGGYMIPYEWAMSASLAMMVISPISSMLYRPQSLHQITRLNLTLLIHTIFSGYNPGDRIISAGV